MKTEHLLKVLTLAKPSLGGADSLLPILSHFCFVDGMVYAYNDITAIIVDADHGLSCALHGDTLLGILDASGTDEVTIKPGKEGTFELRTAGGWVKVPALNVEESPFTAPDEEPKISLPITEEFMVAIERCMISVGQDSLKPEFAGVTLHLTAPRIHCYSSDNKSASRFAFESKFAGRGSTAVVLPTAACELLLKLASACGNENPDTPQIHIGERAAIAAFPNGVTLVTKLLPAQPDLFTKLFNDHANEAQTYTTVPAELRREITKAAVLVSKDTVKEVLLAFAKGKVKVSAAGSLGTMETSIRAGTDETAQVICEPDTLLRVLPYVEEWLPNDARSIVLAGGAFTHVIAVTSQRAGA